jgi:hypothetical protein
LAAAALRAKVFGNRASVEEDPRRFILATRRFRFQNIRFLRNPFVKKSIQVKSSQKMPAGYARDSDLGSRASFGSSPLASLTATSIELERSGPAF